MGRLIDLDIVEFLKVDGNKEFNHGVDCCINTLLKQPTVEAVPKADYKNRLKADMVAMLEDLDLQIGEFDSGCGWDGYIKKLDVHKLIQQKINELKAESEDT